MRYDWQGHLIGYDGSLMARISMKVSDYLKLLREKNPKKAALYFVSPTLQIDEVRTNFFLFFLCYSLLSLITLKLLLCEDSTKISWASNPSNVHFRWREEASWRYISYWLHHSLVWYLCPLNKHKIDKKKYEDILCVFVNWTTFCSNKKNVLKLLSHLTTECPGTFIVWFK